MKTLTNVYIIFL